MKKEIHLPFIEQDPGLALLDKIARFDNLTESEQLCYLTEVNDQKLWCSSVLSVKQKRKIKYCLTVSRELGRIEGRAEGITQGVAEEKQRNYIELLNMAKEMKRKNYPLDDVIAFTKLSREEIEAL